MLIANVIVRLRVKVINSEKLPQLQDEIQQEMGAALNNSNFGEILAKYGVSGNKVLKFKCVLDLE